MNSPIDTRHLGETPIYKIIPLAVIEPSRTDIQAKRRARFNEQALDELAANIRAVGVLQPIVVRDHPDPNGDFDYELVAGERRFLASRKAGLLTVPAVVHALDDAQVLEAQLVENLQRAGLHEMEEAEGYAALMHAKGITADQLADIIGKSRSYVYARLKLCALLPAAREAFYRGDLDASRALYVARITNTKLQERALKLATDRFADRYIYSVRGLREQLTGGQFSVHLSNARFDRADTTFWRFEKTGMQSKLPACSGCPNRTGNCLDLFTQGDDPDVCTDPACFAMKAKQHGERLQKQMDAAGITVLRGEDAKKIAPRKDKLVGHVDIDEPCDGDVYPEPEPDRSKYPGTDDGEATYEREVDAWYDRERAYVSRPIATILANELKDPAWQNAIVHIEDPKTRQIRRLLPYKAARDALKKHNITLNDWEYRPDPVHTPHNSGPAYGSKEYEEQRRKEEEKRERELERRRRLLRACHDAWTGLLKREDYVDIADSLLDSGYVREGLKAAIYNGKAVPEPGQMKDPDLHRLIALLLVSDCLRPYGGGDKGLLAMCKRLKIDPKKAGAEPAPAAAAKKPATAPKKKTATKKAAPAKKAKKGSAKK